MADRVPEASAVHADLVQFKGDKAGLMQHYGEQLLEIVKEHGGNISDIPMAQDHIYHKIQDKIRYLGTLSQHDVDAARLGPDDLEKRKRDSSKSEKDKALNTDKEKK